MAKVLADRDGVEVSEETGIGFVVKVEEPKGGRNALVEINAEHLNIPVTSWVDTAELGLYAAVVEAAQEGYRVHYRVVVKRKRDQPADVPLEQIPSLSRVRDLEFVMRAPGTVVPNPDALPATPAQVAAQEPPAPAPAPVATPSAQGPGGPTCGLCAAALSDGLPVRKVSGVLQHIECPGTSTLELAPGEVSTPATPDDTLASAPAAEPVAAAPPDGSGPPGGDTSIEPDPGRAPRPRIQEGRPWEFANSDGSLNPGSYAYQAAEGTVLMAQDLLLERARRHEGPFNPPTIGQTKALAKLLLRAADIAQASIRADGHVARMAASHSRARAAVRASINVYPVPTGASREDLEEWVATVAERASFLLQLTVDLIDPEALG